MSGVRAQVVLAVAVLLSCTGSALGAQRPLRPKKHPAKHESPPLPQPPPGPLSPLTLAQMPASPPQVTFDNGALTIVAQNSTLGDILRAVHAKTGAVMEISGSATERVASHFGPGSPRDVLGQLLNGTSFNYVILGSAVDAGLVQRVVLSPKSPGGTEGDGQGSASVAESSPQVRTPAQLAQDMSDEEPDSDSEAQEEPATPAPGAEAKPNQSPVKTPEQLLQELQRQQQQIQQQQQQQQQQQGGGESQPNPRQQ